MIRGLLWLPLLILFFWLAFQGWVEFQKVQGYQHWSKNFDQSKFDIYAVLGLKDDDITWGVPIRQGILNLQSFSLHDVNDICLLIDNVCYNFDQVPDQGEQVFLQFQIKNSSDVINIPFTQIDLACDWGKYLIKMKND
jgi:hypothetical protein